MKEYNYIDIEKYLHIEPVIQMKKNLKTWFMFMLFICIPLTLINEKLHIWAIIIISVIILISIWTIFIRKNIEKRKLQYILNLGVSSIIIACTLFITILKYLEKITEIKLTMVFTFIILYLIIVILFILNIFRLLNKGFYSRQSESKSRTANRKVTIFVSMGAAGMLIGRVLVGRISQNEGIIILAVCLFILSLIFSVGGTNYFLKYFILYKFNKKGLMKE